MNNIEKDILTLIKLRRDPTQKLLVQDYLATYFYPALYRMIGDGKIEEVYSEWRDEPMTYKVPGND